MDKDEIVSGLILELRRGTLTLLVLSQLNEATYGYNLVKQLENYGVIIEGNTLYPLMRRLESQGLLKSTWEVYESKPRKYYMTTDLGREVLEKMKDHIQAYTKSMLTLLEGDKT